MALTEKQVRLVEDLSDCDQGIVIDGYKYSIYDETPDDQERNGEKIYGLYGVEVTSGLRRIHVTVGFDGFVTGDLDEGEMTDLLEKMEAA